MKTFEISKREQVECSYKKTQYGFKHTAVLYRDGLAIGTTKSCYYNRTWESFEYESVLSRALCKFSIESKETQNQILKSFREGETQRVNSMFSMIGTIAKLGDMLTDTQKEKNDWKSRILKAGLGDKGLIMPEDWDTLSEKEKESRLNKCIDFCTSNPNSNENNS